MAKLDMRDALSPRDIRHSIATLAFNSLEGKQREIISTALCHKPGTGRKHNVDSVTVSNPGVGVDFQISQLKVRNRIHHRQRKQRLEKKPFH